MCHGWQAGWQDKYSLEYNSGRWQLPYQVKYAVVQGDEGQQVRGCELSMNVEEAMTGARGGLRGWLAEWAAKVCISWSSFVAGDVGTLVFIIGFLPLPQQSATQSDGPSLTIGWLVCPVVAGRVAHTDGLLSPSVWTGKALMSSSPQSRCVCGQASHGLIK